MIVTFFFFFFQTRTFSRGTSGPFFISTRRFRCLLGFALQCPVFLPAKINIKVSVSLTLLCVCTWQFSADNGPAGERGIMKGYKYTFGVKRTQRWPPPPPPPPPGPEGTCNKRQKNPTLKCCGVRRHQGLMFYPQLPSCAQPMNEMEMIKSAKERERERKFLLFFFPEFRSFSGNHWN
jgi:hypothetical protein